MKKYEVIKLGEYDLAPDMCYVDYGGWVDVSSAEVFDRDIADYNELPEINKKALRNFIKSMDQIDMVKGNISIQYPFPKE